MQNTGAVWLLRLIAIGGGGLTWWCFARYVDAGGSFWPAPFWQAVSANALTTAITLDVYLSATAFSVWVWAEHRSRRTALAWVGLCFGVGLVVALPLYLAARLVASTTPARGDHA